MSFQSIEPEVGIGSLIFDWPALYSIRVPPIAREIVCRGCKSRFSATGSTGFADERPICDRCLYRGSPELGMLMALAAAARAFSKLAASEGMERDQRLEQLIEIALSFDDIASRSGPARPVAVLEMEREAEPPDR